MAVKVFYITNATASNSNYGTLTDGDATPALSTTNTGWLVAKTGVNNYSQMRFTNLTASFGAVFVPSANSLNNNLANAWRTQNRYKGSFASSNWVVSTVLRAVVAGGTQDGTFTFRMYRSTQADGTGATEISQSLRSGSVVTNLATSGDQTASLTFNPGKIILDNEYIFASFGWKITGAGGNNNCDVLFRTNTSSSLLTPEYTPEPTYFLVQEGGYVDVE